MNGKLFNCIAVAAVLLMCGQVRAQDPVKPARPMEPPKRPTAEQMAESRTREMDTLLNLDAKQYKKIYKMNLKDAKEMLAGMESKSKSSNGTSEMSMGGAPGMGGGMGQGGPGMGGGMGQGGGMPPMGGMGQGAPEMGGRMGQGSPRMQKDDEETIEKEKAKRAKQLKKILTQGQFQIWQKDEAARESKEFWKAQNDRSDSTVTFKY